MSKKRVHEIAKELKAHGIDLDNKEAVNELLSLGYDVKSHSSSLEDDQATAAVQKILEKRKPKALAPPMAAKGFVVRRRPPEAPLPLSSTFVEPAPPVYAEPVYEPVPENEANFVPQEAVSGLETRDGQSAFAAPPAVEPSSTVPLSDPNGEQSLRPLASESVPSPASATAASPAALPVYAPVRQSFPVRPGGPVVTSRPSVGPMYGASGPSGSLQRPTATQAVLVNRPLIQVRRVVPPGPGQRPGMRPGLPGSTLPVQKAIGEVREFKVIPDSLGRGRELVDVSKNKADRGKKRTTGNEGAPSKQEITDLMWGRVSISIRGKKRKPTKKGAKTLITEMSEDKKIIKLQDGISVSELSQRMGIKSSEIIKKLMTGGSMATVNQVLDIETAGIIATDYGWKIEKVGFEVDDNLPEVEERPEDERSRPPVVTVMGHVDHGKTSLLDAIRQADVAGGEAGGITQHIGSYTVKTAKGDITFLDTPGHEAFTSMRARGANITDIVVLVVAADDGVMPQTIEALNHAKAAEVPIVVAMNKMDTPGANPDRVKKELANHNLLAEDWGGDTIMVPVSAKTKEGVALLLENIALQAELLELTSNPNRAAVGAIIEAKLEKGRGPVATILIQEGTLRTGDAVVTGVCYGRVRAMVNYKGDPVKEVLPGYSAEVTGLSAVPIAGESINVVSDERAAKEIADHRSMKSRQADLGKTSKESLEDLLSRMKSADRKEVRIVLKADVQGSQEAVAQALEKLSTPKVKVELIHRGVGAMTETDVMLAAASKGMVVGFNVKAESGADVTAKAQGVVIRTYSIIYELIDAVKVEMEGLLEPIRTEKKLGRAEVRNLFNVPKLGTIAGVSVIDGTIKRSAFVRLLRDNKQVHVGKMASLRRFKDDVKEVAQGYECGIGIENYSDLKPGDIIEAYEIEETRPSLN